MVWAEWSGQRWNQQGSVDKMRTERLLCADRGLRVKVATAARAAGHKRRTISHVVADMQMCKAAAGGRGRKTRQRLKEWSARKERRRLTARVGGSLSSSSGEALCSTTRPSLPRPLPCCPSHWHVFKYTGALVCDYPSLSFFAFFFYFFFVSLIISCSPLILSFCPCP